jgi:hypothetical protein
VLNSWDRTLIPKPFSRVFVRWGNPFYVPEYLDEAGFETIRQQIEQHMKENQTSDDREHGWEGFFKKYLTFFEIKNIGLEKRKLPL